MIYDVILHIQYDFTHPANAGRHLARLVPADLPGEQRLVAAHLDILPRPDERTDRADFFGNRATDFGFRGAVEGVALHLHARVDRLGPGPHGAPSDRARLAAEIDACQSLAPDAPAHFLAASPMVPADPAVSAYAARAAAGTATVLNAVTALGRALHRDMRFDPSATEVETPMAEAFAARHGVCQDFSHIMISGLRSIGIPAGYVSGFLRTIPPPGKPRQEGADAMHAWVRAWCGRAAGWIDYDPTNAVVVDRDHIVVARGRDYSDVAPVKGVLRTTGAHSSRQTVDVIPLQG